jgi:hypothetical protein
LLPVRYETDRTEFPALPATREVVDRFLGTKFNSWRYERERRLIVELAGAQVDGPRYFLRFEYPRISLREIILGPLCTEDLDAVRATVPPTFPHVTTYKARLAKKSFAVVPDEQTLFWFQIIKSNDELHDQFWKGRLSICDPHQ